MVTFFLHAHSSSNQKKNMLSVSLRAKLFYKYKDLTDSARRALSSAIKPLLMGLECEVSNESLEELYQEWQAACRACAAALNTSQSENETSPMPQMPQNIIAHFSCRRFAAILIERNLYGEDVAGKYLTPAIQMEMINKSCMQHPSTCACKLILDGWSYEKDTISLKHFKEWYDVFKWT